MISKRHSIRNRIILMAVGFALVLALLVASVSFILSSRYLKESQQQAALTNIHVLGDALDSDINTVQIFANWICLDSTLGNYLRTIDRVESSDVQAGRKLSLSAWNHLNNEFNIVGVRNFVNRVLVSTSDGTSFLQAISSGDAQYAGNAPVTIMDSAFYGDLIGESSFKWTGPADDPLSRSAASKVIPVIRPIYSSSSKALLGFVYLDIPERIVTNSLKSFVLAEDDALYITFSEGFSFRYAPDGLQKEAVPDDVISYKMPDTGWMISYLPSASALKKRLNTYMMVIILIFAVILFVGIAMSVLLQRIITRPVDVLIKRLSRISRGDFSRDESIEWENELGEIGRGINSLSESVSDLMEKRLQDEKMRHDLEYQILQSQINPHFLYNTLNTIKWMATIQGSEGISDMSTALSRLMKNISKGTENLIPIRDEFSLVDDYFTIMKYRYGGTIELEYKTEDEALLAQKINRFSLQPIVENAIFHGIEPKGSAGKILICTYREGDNVHIDVTDNGVGMSSAAIDDVLNGRTQTSTEFFRQIGVVNVNERIKYTFGEDYGIQIESKEGEYTTMRFVLPYVSI
ncbi:MAG: sensor histidine kinase [Butyrivibrio sp.]|nr:sensor histidine kinase [Butyrivibrio sp.]